MAGLQDNPLLHPDRNVSAVTSLSCSPTDCRTECSRIIWMCHSVTTSLPHHPRCVLFTCHTLNSITAPMPFRIANDLTLTSIGHRGFTGDLTVGARHGLTDHLRTWCKSHMTLVPGHWSDLQVCLMKVKISLQTIFKGVVTRLLDHLLLLLPVHYGRAI
ncbi:hypothetical protein BDR06DRAFT_147211 [Suillus hirtellus]|nr:hypothetical protein BDR06DRAFT_147211 [Suillus hirtellus]